MLALLCFFLFHAQAAETFAGKAEMNGIKYEDYAGFEEKWKFLTVRYRTDTSEQRFVWANPKALKTLEAGSTDYPDGAVFTKIGFITEEDAAFKSSRVPSGAVRYQFMVRDKVKYASTGGWGYALFDGNKKTLEGDFTHQAQACYACHQLVTNRGQVFSTPLKISAFMPKAVATTVDDSPEVTSVKFATIPLSKAPELVRRSLPQTKSLRSVTGKLTAHVFRGTIDEIRPSLVDEARRTGLPAALIGDDGLQFSVIYPDRTPRKNCEKTRSMKAIFSTSVPSSAPDSSPYTVVAYQDLCV